MKIWPLLPAFTITDSIFFCSTQANKVNPQNFGHKMFHFYNSNSLDHNSLFQLFQMTI